MNSLPAEIFKAYDIRGIVDKSLTADVVRRIGHALGSLALEQGQQAIAVGRDGRLSGPELAGALMEGICAAGCDAIDVGCVPTPVTYFAAYELGCSSCVEVMSMEFEGPAEACEQFGGDRAGDAVAAVHDDLQRAGQLDVGRDARDVGGLDVGAAPLALAVPQVAGFGARLELLDRVERQRRSTVSAPASNETIEA